MRIVVVGNFGLHRKATMASRALPIANELAAVGHDLIVVMPFEPPVSTHAFVDDHVRRRSVHAPLSLPFIGRLLLGLRICWIARTLRPDVVYAFKPIGYAGLALLIFWAARRLGLSRAVLALDSDDWEGEDGWADHDPHPWWERQIMIWQERWALGHADVVTVASRALEALVRTRRASVVYAPNAASPLSPGWTIGDGQAVRQAHALGDAPVVLAYTRFVEFSPDRLIDLFVAIRRQVSAARLLVVGTGLGDQEEKFRRLIRERELDGAVHAIGWVAPERLPAYFAAVDVAVYLLDDSLLNRTKCPMKLVDLLLAGVPVVSDAVGQAREYVRDGETGFLVSAGDVDAMAGKVAALLDDEELRRRVGQAARKEVLASWVWSKQGMTIAEALARAGTPGSSD